MASQPRYSALAMSTNPRFSPGEEGSDENIQGTVIPSPEKRGRTPDHADDTTCGWITCRPNCIQGCNRSVWFLVFWCGFALFQSTTVNGLVYVVTTTLERRFSLTSARSGAISSTFDFTVLAIILFLTYLTERLHKPLLIGCGAVVFGLGSYVFTLPHFLSPNYGSGLIDEGDICRVNETVGRCDQETDGGLSGFYWYFIAGQVLHGIGACPLYTHGRTFVYENVPSKQISMYFAAFQLSSSLGVATGYLFGGFLLTMYTDLKVDTNTLDVTPSSPLWVGNWWLGFLIVGTLAMLMSLPLTGFPKAIRGTEAIRKENERQMKPQKGSEFHGTTDLNSHLKTFPRAIWNLLKNAPLMCINLGVSTEFFIVACTSVFGPKFIETQYNLKASTAAFMAGAVVVPASVVGILTSAWIVKRFNLKYPGQARLCVVSLLVSLFMVVSFLMACPNVPFAGVTAAYDNGVIGDDAEAPDNIANACNEGCNCLDSFAPVCGNDDVMYYSACHAGCSSLEEVEGSKRYTGCACVSSTNESISLTGTALAGTCDVDCNRLPFFLIIVLFMALASSFVMVPSQTMLLSVVSPSQRTTAMGLGSLMFRAFGSVPGPIIFGTIIDNACLIWEEDCYGAKTCRMYQNKQFSVANFTILVVCRSLSLVFFTAALFAYKPSESDGEGEGNCNKSNDYTVKSEL